MIECQASHGAGGMRIVNRIAVLLGVSTLEPEPRPTYLNGPVACHAARESMKSKPARSNPAGQWVVAIR